MNRTAVGSSRGTKNTENGDIPWNCGNQENYSDYADQLEIAVFMGPRDKPEDDGVILSTTDKT